MILLRLALLAETWKQTDYRTKSIDLYILADVEPRTGHAQA